MDIHKLEPYKLEMFIEATYEAVVRYIKEHPDFTGLENKEEKKDGEEHPGA